MDPGVENSMAMRIRHSSWSSNSIFGSGVVRGLATLGAVAAGAAILEAAIVPAVLIGGAAMLAPRLIPRKAFDGVAERLRHWASPPFATEPNAGSATVPASFDTWRAIVKTVTYRVALTTVDFGANYLVVGELTTAAGLSGLSLVAGPIAYFTHEVVWHRYGQHAATGSRGTETRLAGVNVSRTLAKTLTYEGVTAVSEFSVNYFVVRDFAAAAGLAAFSVAVSPIVYYVHERAWESDGDKTSPAPFI
jgi:uncharacterized membrane protein